MHSLLGTVQLVAGNVHDLDALIDHLERNGITILGNPDAFVRAYAHFGVDEARELRDRVGTRAVSHTGRIFIISSPVMSTEAQNALLKTLEDPAGLSTFFIVVPSPDMLLPTVRSRAQTFLLDHSTAPVLLVDPRVFLRSQPQERLDMLTALLEKDSDDKRDLAAAITFLAELERTVSASVIENPEALEAIYRARRYIADKGALVKPLLEQVALLA